MNENPNTRATLDDVVTRTLASIGPVEVPPTLAARAARAAFDGRLTHIEDAGFLATWASLWLRGAVASAALAAASLGVLWVQPQSSATDAATTHSASDSLSFDALATTPDLDSLLGAVVAPATAVTTSTAASTGASPARGSTP